jgi:enoyl-CoA hydratase
MAAAEPMVLFHVDGHVAVFTLNRPKQRNAVNQQLSTEFEAHLDAFEANDALWVGIVCSSAPEQAFCAGADLAAISRRENIQTERGGFAGLVTRQRTKPLIAVVGGPALAGGCEVVLACDLVVASTNALFGVPEVKRSLVPAAGGLIRLPRRIPRNIAMEMMLTGDPISAQRASELGFVNRLVPAEAGPAALMAEARKLAGQITVNAPLAVQEAKQLVDQLHLVPDEDAFLECYSVRQATPAERACVYAGPVSMAWMEGSVSRLRMY